MFGIDGIEFLIIVLVAVIIIGPKDMPKMMRAFAYAAGHMRGVAHDFRRHFEEALSEADAHENADGIKRAPGSFIALGENSENLAMRRKMRAFYASLEQETEEEQAQRLQAEKFAKAQEAHEETHIDSVASSVPSESEYINLDRLAACCIEGRVITAANSSGGGDPYSVKIAQAESEVLGEGDSA